MDGPSEYVTIAEARDLLRVSRSTMTSIVKRGQLATIDNPLDRRSRLIARAEVEALKRRSRPAPTPKGRTVS